MLILIAVLGLCVGSFLNVVIWRLPRGESLVTPPSHCPKCGRMLTPLENIPVVSWVVQRGRCKGCAERISFRYPLIELLTAVLWFLAVVRTNYHPELIAYLVGFTVLVAVAAIDVDTLTEFDAW